jgi:hypothetical protein
MGLNFKELAGAPAAKFEQIGASVCGAVEAAEMVDDLNNPGKQIPVLTLSDEDDSKCKLWARNQMVDAINQALDKAGVDELEVGGWLRVTYTADKALRSGRTMKVYAAEYSPDAATAFGQGALA